MATKDHSLTRGVSTAVQSRIISPERMSPDQRQRVNRYVELVAMSGTPAGVLVGALKGEGEWDLRPLLLDTSIPGGAVTLVRFSDPKISADSARFAELRRLHTVAAGDKKCGILARGEAHGQLWIKRRFYDHTVADVFALSDPYTPAVSLAQFAQKIVVLLERLQAEALIHGHVCTENIAFQEGEPVLLDFGFTGFESAGRAPGSNSSAAGLAPEILRGATPSPGADVYGLGGVLRQLLGHAVSVQQTRLIESMLAPDRAARPGLPEITALFAPARRELSRLSGTNRSMVKSGRVLSRDLLEGAPQPPVMPGSVSPAREEKGPVRTGRPLPPAAQKPVIEQAPPKGEPETVSGIKTLVQAISNGSTRALMLLCFVLLIAVLYLRSGSSYTENDAQLQLLWDSNQPSRMQEVVDAAINDSNRAAQDVIIGTALAGTEKSWVRNRLLRVAFNPLWEKELSSRDRKIALMLALSKLGNFESQDLPSLADAHPAVLLAAVGDLDLDLAEGKFSEVSTLTMARLPPPFGQAFDALARLGVKDLSAPAARALCHIAIGDVDRKVLETFFEPNMPEPAFLMRLLTVEEFAESNPPLAEALYAVCAGREDIFARRVEWFESEEIAQWSKAPKTQKLSLIAGEVPENGLDYEQLADLLKFPGSKVRKEAVKQLEAATSSKNLGKSIAFLASDQNQLSRLQLVSLMVALRLDGEESYLLLGRWFNGTPQPDPQSVLDLLIERGEITKIDPFNVEAARYLSSRDWRASLEQLDKLVSHGEPLARALAYSRLDPSVPDELGLLKKALRKEPNQKIRDEIARKVQSVVPPEGSEKKNAPAAGQPG